VQTEGLEFLSAPWSSPGSFGRDEFTAPVPYLNSCSPQAWAAAAPLLVRSALALQPHVPHRTMGLTPRLPERWGRLTLADLRLDSVTVRVDARANH
jgi:glycogen debranching enzyme